MAATIYMIFGRLARVLHVEKHSIVRVSLLTKLFVGGDVLAFVMQGWAAGLLMVHSMATAGKALVVLGLAVQIISFSQQRRKSVSLSSWSKVSWMVVGGIGSS